MKKQRWNGALAAALTLMALGALAMHDAPPVQACSCAGPGSQLWAPLDSEPAALNSRITLALPKSKQGTLVVRPVGGSPITTSEQRFAAGWQEVVVLTPDKPLTPNTRYEVAWVDEPQHPRTLVFGTFATADFSDNKGPVFEPIQQAVFHDETVMAMTSCQSQERWLEAQITPAQDDQSGPLLYALWVADAKGKLDLKAPPLVLVPTRNSPATVIFGATGMCSPLRVSLPKGPGRLRIAIAAVDSAGNISPQRQSVVTIPKGKP